MEIKADASQSNDGTQKGKEQVVVAAVVSISEDLLRCAGLPALSQPAEGCETPSPMFSGGSTYDMFKQPELVELVLTALFNVKLKAVFDVHKVDIVDGANGRELSLTGCIPGDDEAYAFSFRVSFGEDEHDDLHGLIAKLGLPEQPPVPEYDLNDFLDLVGAVTGLDTSEVEAIDTTDEAVLVLYQGLPQSGKLAGDALTVLELSLCGIPLEDLSESDLWTLIYTLEHHGEFHALCSLYRLYELAE